MPIYRVKERGASGLARVTVSPDKIKVKFEDASSDYLILPEDAPEGIKTGTFFVTLSSDESKIYSVRPPKGSYWAKFKNFSHKKDELPIYREVAADVKRKKTGETYPVPAHLEFTALFKVTKGDFSWMELPYFMWYAFKAYANSGETAISGRGSQKVEEFLVACGFDFMKDSIPYSENVLPALEKLIVEKDQDVMITVNEYGYIDTLFAAPSDK